MGGQIPNNLALPLSRYNVKIVGTHPDMIDNAENRCALVHTRTNTRARIRVPRVHTPTHSFLRRYKFSRMLDSIMVDQPQWKELTSLDEIKSFCESVGYQQQSTNIINH